MERKKKLLRRFSVPLSLLLLVLLAYWPLLVYSMKFDILDQYFPWRYLVGQCLQSGHLPLWNPYTHLGYPLYDDPQSGAWYPVVWFIGGLFGYNIYWIQGEYLFHIWLAGCGMFLLVNALVKNKNVAWLAGASYLLSGFFTGNAQHLTWIISGAWIPFILYFFLMMSRSGGLKYSLLCAFCVFMLVTGGYPAFTIVLLYILIFLGILIIIRKWYRKFPVVIYIKSLTVFSLATILLSAVMMVSVFESFHIAGRAEGLSREFAMANPFSPQSMFSWLFPLSSVKNAAFFDTDASMSNGYFGLLMLAGLMASFFRKKTFLEIIILAGSLFFLIAAMGSYMPLRGWLFDFIPLMNLFRMPGLFRLFAMIGFILLGSFTITEIYIRRANINFLKNALKTISLLLISVIILIIYKGVDWNSLIYSRYIIWLQEIKFNESTVLQGTVQLVCVTVLLYCLKKRKYIYWLVIDGVLACWLCAPITIVSDWKVSDLHKLTNQFPSNFRIPDLSSMDQNVDRNEIVGPLWCNLGIWRKQPIWDGYNNFQTKDFLRFEKSALAKYVLKNPIIYQSLSASFSKDLNADTLLMLHDKTHLLIASAKYNAVQIKTGINKQLSPPALVAFTPWKIEAIVNNSIPCYFTLLQQNLRGWKVYIDEKESEIFCSNGLFISTEIPAGMHKVIFIFSDREIVIGFYISVISLLSGLIIIIISRKSIPGLSPYF